MTLLPLESFNIVYRSIFCFWCFIFYSSAQIRIFFFFGHAVAYGILVPWPRIKPRPLQLKHWVLTTGVPGNSLEYFSSLWSYDIFWYLKDYSPHFPCSKNFFLVFPISFSCIVMHFHYLKKSSYTDFEIKDNFVLM